MTSQQPISANTNKLHVESVGPAKPAGEKIPVDCAAFKAVLERLENAARDLSKRSESLTDAKDLSGVVADAASSLGDALALRDSVMDAYRGAEQASKAENEEAA
jgi:hypothetical protein